VYVPQLVQHEAIVKVPKPQIQRIPKEIPKMVLQSQEKVVDIPQILRHERAVEVPVVKAVETVTQIPQEQVQMVEKPVHRVVTQVQEREVAVPMTVVEQRLKRVENVVEKVVRQEVLEEVAQTRDIPVRQINPIQVDKKATVPVTLLHEKGVEVPQTLNVEIVKQRPAATRQVFVHTAKEREIRAVQREAVVHAQAGEIIGEAYQPVEIATGTRIAEATDVIEEQHNEDSVEIMLIRHDGAALLMGEHGEGVLMKNGAQEMMTETISDREAHIQQFFDNGDQTQLGAVGLAYGGQTYAPQARALGVQSSTGGTRHLHQTATTGGAIYASDLRS